jgi:ubiquinone/menaquinone biosynthesis C-methylase UbiE
MSLNGRIFAALYDRTCAASEEAGVAEMRRELLAGARGRVLEVGAGTGLNLAHYPGSLDELVLAEPEAAMARRLERRLPVPPTPARVVRAPAEALPFEDDTFDTVVATLVLCTVRDPDAALREVARVLRPGGRFLFLEHVRSDDPAVAAWQARLRPFWKRLGHGCHLDRATAVTLEASPLRVERMDAVRIPKAPKIVRSAIVGSAVA